MPEVSLLSIAEAMSDSIPEEIRRNRSSLQGLFDSEPDYTDIPFFGDRITKDREYWWV